MFRICLTLRNLYFFLRYYAVDATNRNRFNGISFQRLTDCRVRLRIRIIQLSHSRELDSLASEERLYKIDQE